jgi:antirestriction protein ArdC
MGPVLWSATRLFRCYSNSSIGSWPKVLPDDTRATFTAASHADRATSHLDGHQPPTQTATQVEARSPSAMPDSSHRAHYKRLDAAKGVRR